jgi:hypothetical protein
VDVASVEKTLDIKASRGVNLVADKLIEDCPGPYDLIALPVRVHFHKHVIMCAHRLYQMLLDMYSQKLISILGRDAGS